MPATSAVLDTRAVPPSERPGYWTDGITRHFFPMHVEAVGASSLEARLISAGLGPAAVGAIRGHPHRVARTSRLIAAGDPESILLYLVRRGAVQIEQAGRQCELYRGDIACQDTSRPSSFEARAPFEIIMFSLPRWFVGAHADVIARRTSTRVEGRDGRLARLAAPFLTDLARVAAEGDGLSPGDGEVAAEMLLPMVRNIFADETPPGAVPRAGSMLARMQRYATAHLDDPQLGPQRLAEAHFVSPRYVHKLFASTGTGVSEWIRERRMEGATADLHESPGMAISAVAERWGYRNAASFSRAFRERYGCAPRDVRGRD